MEFFEKIDQIDDVAIFYSCPGKIVNEESSNVVKHYQDTLDEKTVLNKIEELNKDETV